MTNLRYSIGEEIIACSFIDEKCSSISQPYMFFSFSEEIVGVRFIKLKVKEHVKVPGEFDDEKQYDGFILEGDDGKVYHNQYPYACYGQLDDKRNRVFTLEIPKGKFKEVFENSKEVPYEYILLNEVYPPIWKAVNEDLEKLPSSLKDKLLKLNDMFLKEFEEKFPDLKIEVKNHSFTEKDGTVVELEGLKVVHIKKKVSEEENS